MYCPFKEGRNTMERCESDCAFRSEGECVIKKYMESQISRNNIEIQKHQREEEFMLAKHDIF